MAWFAFSRTLHFDDRRELIGVLAMTGKLQIDFHTGIQYRMVSLMWGSGEPAGPDVITGAGLYQYSLPLAVNPQKLRVGLILHLKTDSWDILE